MVSIEPIVFLNLTLLDLINNIPPTNKEGLNITIANILLTYFYVRLLFFNKKY